MYKIKTKGKQIMNTGNVSKQTMDEYIDTVFKEIKAKFQKAKFNLDDYQDLVAETVFEQYEYAKKEQNEDKVTIEIGIHIGLSRMVGYKTRLKKSASYLLLVAPAGIVVQEKLPTDDKEYVRKRLKNRLKDLKDFELEVLAVGKDEVILHYTDYPDPSALKHFIAKTGVSALAQKGIKSQALPNGNGIKFIINRDSEE